MKRKVFNRRNIGKMARRKKAWIDSAERYSLDRFGRRKMFGFLSDEAFESAHDFFDSIDVEVEFRPHYDHVYASVRRINFCGYEYDPYDIDIPEGESSGFYVGEILLEAWNPIRQKLQEKADDITSVYDSEYDDYDGYDFYSDFIFDLDDEYMVLCERKVQELADYAAELINDAIDEEMLDDGYYASFNKPKTASKVGSKKEATRKFTYAEMQELDDEVNGKPWLNNADRLKETDSCLFY